MATIINGNFNNANEKENNMNTLVAEMNVILGTNGEARLQEVSKNNGIVLHGVSIIREGNSVSPVVYLESFLGETEITDANRHELARDLISTIEAHMNQGGAVR